MLNKWLSYAGFTFGLLLPASTTVSNVVLIIVYLLSITVILQKKSKLLLERRNLILYSTIVLIIPSFFSLLVFGLDDYVLNTIERRITFLISPLVFFSLPQASIKGLRYFSIIGIILGTTLVSIYLITKNLGSYFKEKGGLILENDLFNYYHTNKNFMDVIDIHPSYFGIYVVFALAGLFYCNKIKINRLKVPVFIILSTAVFFLNSRIILFLYTVFLVIVIYKSFQRKHSRQKVFFGTFLVSCVLFFATYYTFRSTYLFERFSKEISWELTDQVGTRYNSKNHGDSRIARWKAAVYLISQKPLFGYGAGFETETLKQEYIVRNMRTSVELEYNSHNQFITTTIEGGIFALGLTLLFFAGNFYWAFKRKDLVYLYFIFSVLAICMFESYLKRNAGITFLGFYATIFLVDNASDGFRGKDS